LSWHHLHARLHHAGIVGIRSCVFSINIDHLGAFFSVFSESLTSIDWLRSFYPSLRSILKLKLPSAENTVKLLTGFSAFRVPGLHAIVMATMLFTAGWLVPVLAFFGLHHANRTLLISAEFRHIHLHSLGEASSQAVNDSSSRCLFRV